MSALLAAESVSYRIDGATLVEDVSLSVEPGRLTVVVGPNGAGKSSLLKLLSGEVAPSAGRVSFDGIDLRGIPPWKLACMRCVLPQSSRLAFPFTAGEIVRIGLDGIGRGMGRRDREGLAAQALRRADVSHLAARTFQTLSGGEQQRIQFARVLAQLMAGRSVAPRQALLLDEPISSLDLKHQLGLLEAISDLAREGTAVLAILHDLNLASAFADEIVVMSGGRAVARGAPEAVVTNDMIRDVFDVALRVGHMPPPGQPFLLPRRA